MNARKFRWLVLLIALAIVMVPVQRANARNVKTYFTGSEVWVEDIDPGVETFADKTIYHLRDAVAVFSVQTTDPRVSGEDRVVVNWNFKLVDPPVSATGRMWGTFTISNEAGYWKGNWTGVRDRNGFSYFKYTGKGYGAYKGMQLHMRLERLTPDGAQPEQIRGYILEAEQ